MSNILVIAEHDGENLNGSTARAVNCASDIGGTIDVAVFAAGGEAIANQAAALAGVAKVLLIDNSANEHNLAAILAPQIAELAGSYSHVLAPNTTFGKDVMPRAAALAGVAQVSDIMKVNAANSFDRPIYAGNAVTTVETAEGSVVFGTVRCASYPEADEGGSAAVEATTVAAELPSHTRFVSQDTGGSSDRPDLQAAAKVVSGGRAMGSSDAFEIIFSLADKLGAGVGASRAAVDAGYVPSDMQVGQTGKIIAPDLYIACGISGAIQHLAGIKDAGTIVAINKDPDAPVFEVADFGLVGDLFVLVPELEAALS